MSFTEDQEAAFYRATQYSHQQYDAVSNPFGFGGVGYLTPGAAGLEGNWAQSLRDMATLASAANSAAQQTAEDADATAGDRDEVAANLATVNTLLQAAQAAADAAAAWAAQAQGTPFVTTEKNANVYDITLADYVIGDGAKIGLNIDEENDGQMYLRVNDGTSYQIVEPGDYSLESGRFQTGRNYALVFEGATNQWVIQNGTDFNKLRGDLNAAGFKINNLRGWKQLNYRGGLAAVDGLYCYTTETAERWHAVRPVTDTGTADITLYVNGMAVNFGGAPSTTVTGGTAFTSVPVNDGGNDYYDLPANSIVTLDIANITDATRMTIGIDKTGGFQA
tara:strand:- start:233 stop:1237 length:1005 start_codon:yes stop_codon:yes gene_type:complete